MKSPERSPGRLSARFLALPAWCLLAALSVLPHPPVRGQELDQDEWSRGYNGFALICRSLQMEPAESIRQWRRTPPNRSVLVVFGSTKSLREPMERFVQAGGHLLVATDQTTGTLGKVVYRAGPWRVKNSFDGFKGYYDESPLIRQFSTAHPVTRGLQKVVANRSGTMFVRNRTGYQNLATLPVLETVAGDRQFLIASPADSGKRELYCSDQSAFSNQMLFYHDNARLALQALNWLKDDDRRNLLLLVDGQPVNPADPSAIDVDLPSPTRDEILRNLRNLPPDKLIQFGNAVATLVEDENLVNEFLSASVDRMGNRHYFRALLFLLTFLLGGFLFFRYMASESLLQDATGTHSATAAARKADTRRKTSRERQLAARELLKGFYSRVSGQQRPPARDFPAGLQLVRVQNPAAVRREMRKTGRRVARKRAGWWTPGRLGLLQLQLDDWDHLYKNGQLVPADNERNPASPRNKTVESTPSDLKNQH